MFKHFQRISQKAKDIVSAFGALPSIIALLRVVSAAPVARVDPLGLSWAGCYVYKSRPHVYVEVGRLPTMS